MLLAIDIGNTNIDLGLFDDNQLLLHRKIPTAIEVGEEVYRTRLREQLFPYSHNQTLGGAVVGSVVANLGETLVAAARPLCDGIVLQAEPSWQLGLTIEYDDPARVGIDRLVAAAAAFSRVPVGHGLVIADAGTAITVDAIDADGTFLGGLILPGLRLGLKALHRRASLLPAIELAEDIPLLGKNTRACMQAGALHGGAAMLDGLFDRIASQLACPLEGFLTGGDSASLMPHLVRYPHCHPTLVLEGLRLAYTRQLMASY